MGSGHSKLDTSVIPLQQIKSTSPVEQGRFCPPFRRFRNQIVNVNDRKLEATVQIQQPNHEQISIYQQYFKDLQDAFDTKTKQIQLYSTLTDDQYIDIKTYLAKQKDKDIAIQLRPFQSLNSYAFNNIMYEIHMNEQIAKLSNRNICTIKDKYVIQTGLQIQGEQNPNTQVYQFEAITTNLSQMIKYRRQNRWAWTEDQFNALAYDLCNALKTLHAAKISHNDIRPCNILYSLEKNCYQLSNFANAVKTQQGRAGLEVSQVRTSVHYGAPQLTTSKQANFQQADIYSLGMTLLCAFYLCEPIDRKAVAQYNKKFQSQSSAMSAIREMIMPIDKRSHISNIAQRIPKGESPSSMQHLISSLRYKNAPKDRQFIASKKLLSEGYKRLGLWNDWKTMQYEAYQLQQSSLDDYKKANALSQLAKIQSCRGELQSADEYSKSASKIYRVLGYTSYERGNINQSLNLFTRATQCSKYFLNKNDIETAKNLQGLALAHSEKGDYQLSKPLINQASAIVIKNFGRNSIDYCKIKISEAKIESEFGNFLECNRILSQCLSIAESKCKLNQQLWLKLKAQILHQQGRNSMRESQHSPQDQQRNLLMRAEKLLADAISLNQQFPNNHLALASNIDVFGQIDLRKHNYPEAINNFNKARELRDAYVNQNQGLQPLVKQQADTLCNIAACENGAGDSEKAIKSYNQALQIYRSLYGSDHNKFSAIAIGNMSKVYYKLNDKSKARECIKIATQILADQMGDNDPDYEYFKKLETTL